MKFDKSVLWLVPAMLVAGAGISASELSMDEYRAHVVKLASDEFEGRKPASRGEEKTVAYLTQQFKRLGLAPGNNGSFVQQVPLVEITAAPDASLVFKTRGEKQATRYGEDMVVWTKRVVPDIEVRDSPLVFVGHGVVAPEYGWNDYAGVDMRGKTALILINDPGFADNDPYLFRGRAMTYYGRWTYKYEEAQRQGAAGAIIIHETAPAAYGWDTVQNSWSGPQLDQASADGNMGRLAFEGWITLDRATGLLASVGQNFDALKARAQRKGFKAVPLDATASAKLRNGIRRSNSANVVATIPGASQPGEYVVFMGHWDHLGQSLAGKGDTIFNGAVDNATGVSGLLTVASAMMRDAVKPARTVVFLAVTAEESGLLGSAYYADNPIFPLAQTVAVLNMDAMYFGGPTKDVAVIGFGASELEKYLGVEAAKQDRVLKPEPTSERGFFYRSDHFNFAKKGVPALYFDLGLDDRENGRDFAEKQREDYIKARYHQVGDEIAAGSDLRGGFQDLQLHYGVGRTLAMERTFPEWNAGNEFKAIRDRSRAIMK